MSSHKEIVDFRRHNDMVYIENSFICNAESESVSSYFDAYNIIYVRSVNNS